MAVLVLLGTTFIDRGIRSTCPAKTNICSQYSLPVNILMVLENSCVAEKEEKLIIAHLSIEDLALLVTPMKRKPIPLDFARQVVMKVMCKTLVLVSTQMAGLIDIAPHNNVAKTHACMLEK